MKLIANLARIVRTYAIALWVGGLVFFVMVAQVAFTGLPTTHQAGIVVRGSLLAIHNLGLYAGLIYILCTIVLLALGDRARTRGVEVLLVTAMLALTAYSQFHIVPTMEGDRQQLSARYGAEVDATPKSDPAHADFDRLHNVSTKVEGAVLLLGLAVLALGSLQRSGKWQVVSDTF